MKRILSIVLAMMMTFALLTTVIPAGAQELTPHEPAIGGEEKESSTSQTSNTKWRQAPDMKYGVNIPSTEDVATFIVADDWRCTTPRPVTDVHFWGSYVGWEESNPIPPIKPPRVNGFFIRMYEDVPAGASYSHPGALLYETEVLMFEEEYVATLPLADRTYEHKFYYSLDLLEPFRQVEGTIYWLSVSAIMPERYTYPWGWETSYDHWNDNACKYDYIEQMWVEITPLDPSIPQWYPYNTVDMAFELTVAFEPPPPLEPIKWQQRPDMVQGVNIVSNPEDETIVADDWLCLDGSPVTDLHFWGSYPGWMEHDPAWPEDTPGVSKFRIQVYSDVPASSLPDEFSRPGELLYEAWVSNFTETYVASIPLPGDLRAYEHKYRYDLDLPEPFEQERGTIYWLSIAAMPTNSDYLWGWESSMDRWNDFAVQRPDGSQEWELIYHPWTEKPIDMAFELTTGEGPIKWLQFPDMAEGTNIVSLPKNPVVADDWLCTDGTPITEVHFWGSYLDPFGDSFRARHWEQDNPGPPDSPLPSTPGVERFKLSFHNDIPAGVNPDMPWSHPGELIREVGVEFEKVEEQYWDSVPHVDVTGQRWWEHKFYYIILLEEPFKQEKGTVYWLDVGAQLSPESNWLWGWETSKDHWNDSAVEGWEGGWEPVGTVLAPAIDLEDLPLGNMYSVGDIFASSGISIEVKPFQWSNGTWTFRGSTTVENGGQAGGLGNEMNVNNVNLDFAFGAPLTYLSLLFGEYGGNINIEINGDFRNFDSFFDINGLTIGGVNVLATDLGGGKGQLTLSGTIGQFAIGGQELWIDDVKGQKQVDMAFLLSTSELCCPGDADGDGDVDVFDWVKVRRILEGLDDPTPGADADGDGDVDVFDWVKVRRILEGLDPYPCPSPM